VGRRPADLLHAWPVASGQARSRTGLCSDRISPCDHREVRPWRADHSDVTVFVGPTDGHSRAAQPIHQPLVGVSVVVASPDRDHRNTSLDCGEKRWVLVRAAVVGDLQDVGGEIGSAAQQVTLRLELDVPSRQHRHRADTDPGYDRGVVGIGSGADVADHRAEHLDPRDVHHPGLPRPERDDRDSCLLSQSTDPGISLHGQWIGAGGDRAHVSAAEDSAQALDVIGMQVREQDHRDVMHSEPAQASVHEQRIRTRVDHHGTAGPERYDERISLAHIAGHQCPPGRRPGRCQYPHRQAAGDDPDASCGRQPPDLSPAQQHDGYDDDRHQHERAYRPFRPGHDGSWGPPSAFGDPDHPAQRPVDQSE